MTLGKISLIGDFQDPQQELRFRAYTLESARRINLLIASIVLFAALAFTVNDYSETGFILEALLPRLVIAAVAVGCIVLTCLASTQTVTNLAIIVLVACVALLNTYITMSRPPDFLLHLGIDAIIVLSIYIVLPTVPVQLIFAVSLSSLLIFLHFKFKEPAYAIAHITVPLTLLLANLIGLGMSILYNRTRHQLFAQIEALQAAQEDVEQLSALVPMCASCKSIRDDDGYWQQVETYMKENTGAVVSHSVCPKCVETLGGSSQTGRQLPPN